MKKTSFLLIIAVCILSSQVFGQTIVYESKPPKAFNGAVLHPLVLVDNLETDMESMSVDPNNIETISVLKNGSALDKYGEKAKDGAILITTKPGTQFYKITDFVDSSKDLNKNVTKIQLNGKLLPDANKLLIDKTAFTSSMLSTECKLGASLTASPEETLVISTKFAGKK